MLIRLGSAARRWLADEKPWTDVYGLARTLIASATALTLIFSHSSSLFRPGVGLDQAPVCSGARAGSLFCLVPSTHLEIARWVAVAILLVVASGWRPRITGVLHWWVSLGLFSSAVMVDGGDQCAAVLSLLLLPVTLADPRTWHWQRMPATYDEKAALLARSALALVRLQVAGIYFHAAIGKMPVEEWSDGTALYYWLLDPTLGAASWLSPSLHWLLLNGTFVACLTWSVLALETLLFMGLVAPKPLRRWLLVGGLFLHAGIIVIHGLWSFGLTMFGALILFLRPFEQEFDLGRVVRSLWRWDRWRLPASGDASRETVPSTTRLA